MPKIKEVTLYTFSELSEKAKEYAIQKQREEGFDYEWWDSVYEDATNIGRIMGITISKIYFSGFYSQGDGACFEGSYSYFTDSVKNLAEYAPQDETLESIVKGLLEMQKKYGYTVEAEVRHKGHYYHYNCTDIWVRNSRSNTKRDGLAAEECSELLRQYMRWIYKQLEQCWDSISSDKAISELLSDSREHEYLASGKLDIE